MERTTVATVDDNALARRNIKGILDQDEQMICVAEYASGDQACRDMHWTRPHVVLQDVFMPGMNGIEILHRLRSMPRPPKIIMVSSCDDPEIIEYCHCLGAMAYLIKPVSKADLCRTIMKALEGAGLWPDQPVRSFGSSVVSRIAAALLAAYARHQLFTIGRQSANGSAVKAVLRAARFSVGNAAILAAHSIRTFRNRFELARNRTPSEFFEETQKDEARELLENGIPIAEAACQAGFDSVPAFYVACHRWFGRAPGSFVGRKGSRIGPNIGSVPP